MRKVFTALLILLFGSIIFNSPISAVIGQWSSNGNLINYQDGNVSVGVNSTDRGNYRLQLNGNADGSGKANLLRLSHHGSLSDNDRFWTFRTLNYGRADYGSYALEISQPASSYSGCVGCGGDLVLRPWRNVVIRSSNTAVDAKLLVYGEVQAKQVRVTLGSQYWPDYVFEENYDLMSLSELNNFINEYKHLPNIPSAELIGKEGISIGDMQRLQMEKIEELTLHLIEKDKEINDLKTRMERLEGLITIRNIL